MVGATGVIPQQERPTQRCVDLRNDELLFLRVGVRALLHGLSSAFGIRRACCKNLANRDLASAVRSLGPAELGLHLKAVDRFHVSLTFQFILLSEVALLLGLQNFGVVVGIVPEQGVLSTIVVTLHLRFQ